MRFRTNFIDDTSKHNGFGYFILGSSVSDGIEFQTGNPLPQITRIFADWFENSRPFVKSVAEIFSWR
jgi:hypothetical protein